MTTISPHPPPSSTATAATAPSSSTATTTGTESYTFPPIYTFPPFFTLQPNPTTRSSQLSSWSTHIQSYCRHHRLFSISLIDLLPTPLFTNATISRSLSLRNARAVVQWMSTSEGGNRAEWIHTSGAKKSAKAGGEGEGEGGKAWIYWRRPEEWATALEEWVERTGQKGTVLTLYELTESDATRREEFYGMEGELLQKSLQICVKRGKAQVFGGEGSEGVKFF
ncbi:ESCRT-II complex, vps25 subunit [Byssothecium circinans]|uniref:Vacuolar protein-sorting-associated protein 25 n=1 Tax=Byssothecium circinans TaxID=147558 RepID=A0A6A5TUV3_9PLEO|nr:ESCRT-II complex, vps25 subunit [Byssothecium circinans]